MPTHITCFMSTLVYLFTRLNNNYQVLPPFMSILAAIIKQDKMPVVMVIIHEWLLEKKVMASCKKSFF